MSQHGSVRDKTLTYEIQPDDIPHAVLQDDQTANYNGNESEQPTLTSDAEHNSNRLHTTQDPHDPQSGGDESVKPPQSEFDKQLKSINDVSAVEELQRQAVERWDPDHSIHGSIISSSGHASLRFYHNSSSSPSAVSLRDGSIHQGRRSNPKVSRVRNIRVETTNRFGHTSIRGPQEGHVLPMNKVSSSLVDGTPLFRISETVPFLLGPPAYLTGLDALMNFNIPPIIPRDMDGNEAFTQHLTGSRDRALLVILMFASQPEGERSLIVFHLLAPFVIGGERVVCWKDGVADQPEEITITFHEFGIMLREWQNPFTLFDPANDYLAMSRWSEILEMLKARGIPVEVMDQNIFAELTSIDTEDELKKKLDQLQYNVKTGKLDQYRRHKYRVQSEVFDYVEPLSQDPQKLYSYRFSHANPTGELHDAERGRTHDTYLDGEDTKRRLKPSLRAVVKERKTRFNQTKYAKAIKWTAIVLIGLGIMGVIVAVCFFKVGSKNKKGFGEEKRELDLNLGFLLEG